jgi:steroid 5-alpha reductase family enzyme
MEIDTAVVADSLIILGIYRSTPHKNYLPPWYPLTSFTEITATPELSDWSLVLLALLVARERVQLPTTQKDGEVRSYGS